MKLCMARGVIPSTKSTEDSLCTFLDIEYVIQQFYPQRGDINGPAHDRQVCHKGSASQALSELNSQCSELDARQ